MYHIIYDVFSGPAASQQFTNLCMEGISSSPEVVCIPVVDEAQITSEDL